jgi:hypothetical protein
LRFVTQSIKITACRKPVVSRVSLWALNHAGFHIKQTIRQFLENSGAPVKDLGTWSEESLDHPDYGKGAGKSVADRKDDYGIAVRGRWPRDPRCQPRPGA